MALLPGSQGLTLRLCPLGLGSFPDVGGPQGGHQEPWIPKCQVPWESQDNNLDPTEERGAPRRSKSAECQEQVGLRPSCARVKRHPAQCMGLAETPVNKYLTQEKWTPPEKQSPKENEAHVLGTLLQR